MKFREPLLASVRRIPWRRWLALGLGLAAAGAALALFVLFGPPRLLAYSESPEFCVRCHNHEVEGEAFSHSGAHRRKRCIECHLPNGSLADHFLWKGIDGMSDVFFFFAGMFRDESRLSPRGRRLLQANCIRCHETTVMDVDQGRPCWDCHRRQTHKGAALVRTL